MKPSDFAYHLSEYLGKYLPGRLNLSEDTVMSYRDTFTLLLRYYRETTKISVEKIKIAHLTKEHIESFLRHLEDDRHCPATTINQRLAAIHAFFKYLQTEAPENMFLYQQILSIRFKKTQHGSFVEHISLGAMQAILAEPDISTLGGRHDLILLALMYDTSTIFQSTQGKPDPCRHCICS